MNKQIKLLTILGSVALIGGVSTLSVLTTSCGKEKIDIRTAITNIQLGPIQANTWGHVTAKIMELNPDSNRWDWQQLYMASITGTHATIWAEKTSRLYTGNVTVYYTLPHIDSNWADIKSGDQIQSINLSNAQTDYGGFDYSKMQVTGNIINDTYNSTNTEKWICSNTNGDMTTVILNQLSFAVVNVTSGKIDRLCYSTSLTVTWANSFHSDDNQLSWNAEARTVTFDTPRSITDITSVAGFNSFFQISYFEIVTT